MIMNGRQAMDDKSGRKRLFGGFPRMCVWVYRGQCTYLINENDCEF